MQVPNNFPAIYKCKIEHTGEKIYKIPPYRPPFVPLSDNEKWAYDSENEIAIKMPESEYIRFLTNWNQYMDIMQAAGRFPHIRDQYHQLLALASIMK
jgi:hypothetical protein